MNFVWVNDDNISAIEAWLTSQSVIHERFGQDLNLSLKKQILVQGVEGANGYSLYTFVAIGNNEKDVIVVEVRDGDFQIR